MKALTLTQPYATLVSLGVKKIETRSWATSYRGPLAIHAAAGYGKGGRRGYLDLCCAEPFLSVLQAARSSNAPGQFYADELASSLPHGAIVAVCELVGCVLIIYDWPRNQVVSLTSGHRLTDQERAFGDYAPGRFAWLLTDVRALPEPIPAKGALGLWEWAETGLW